MNRRRGQFSEFSLSAGHHRRQYSAAARLWAYLTAALAFILYGAVLELNYFQVVPSFSITHPGIKHLASDYLREPVRISGHRVSGRSAGRQAAAGRHAARSISAAHSRVLQALHENIIQSISSGLITTGLDGRITLVNTAA